MPKKYPWYEIVSSETPILQGDFIYKCPIALLPSNVIPEPDKEIDISVENYNVVIMSQSCDLENNKVSLVLVCPFYTLDDFAKTNTYFNSQKGKEALRRGDIPGQMMLEACTNRGHKHDILVLDFQKIFSVPIESLRAITSRSGRRKRLLPPYREHLSQSFARFFMRVGLPLNITPFS